MRLSALQRFILIQCLQSKNRTADKKACEKFYDRIPSHPSKHDITTIITRSVERLVEKELVIVYGWHTAQKWFIDRVRLTKQGSEVARRLLGVQQKFTFKNR